MSYGEPSVNLNALIRGQSNALLMIESNGWAGYGRIVQRVQELLGFDGVRDTVSIEYASGTANGANTVNSGTAFLKDWIGPDGAGGWTVRGLERGLLDYINALPAARKAEPTAVVWLHNEYDATQPGLTPETWASGVRFDAALVRQAFGQSAAELPYLFVSAIPYWASDAGHQAIRIGMEDLAADPGFNAAIAARALDLDMSHDDLDGNWRTADPGGPHISDADGALIAERIARSLAQEWAEYARPGSPVALAGGNIDNLGPEVVQASPVGGNQLVLTVRFDAASSLAALDPDAARGVGWSVSTPAGMRHATAVELRGPNGLLVTFDGPVGAGDRLHYGYGYGRLSGADGGGQGNAVYDDQGLPIWVPARGLEIGAAGTAMPAPAPVPPPAPAPAPAEDARAPVSLSAGTGPDRLVLWISQDHYLGDAQYTVTVDGVQVGGIFTASALHVAGGHDTLTLRGDWGPGPHQVEVTLLNDLWHGTPETDRNLYVPRAEYNGVASDALGEVWYGGCFTVQGAAAAAWAPVPEPAAAVAVDWNALAAQVMAHYEATGCWYL